MKGKIAGLLGPIFVAGDMAALILAFASAWLLRVSLDSRPLLNQISGGEYFASLAVIIPFFILTFAVIGLYRRRVIRQGRKMVPLVVMGCFVGTLVVIAYEYVIDRPVYPARLMMVYVLAISVIMVLLMRGAISLVFRLICRKTRVLLIGNSKVAGDFAKRLLEDTGADYKIVAYAGPKKYLRAVEGVKHYSEPEDALGSLRRLRIGAIIQTNLYENRERNREILHKAEELHLEYRFVPGEAEFYLGKNEVDVVMGYPMLLVSQTPLMGWGLVIKRGFDLVLAAATVPVWGVVFLLVVGLQKVLNPGKVFFRQVRLGRYGKEFRIYKFRSMREDLSGQDAIEIFRKMGREDLAKKYAKGRKIENDPRVAGWWGKFLRRSSLDEFAQIINLLRGDMSLVGPRPILPDELDFYRSRSPLLLSVKPGLTGFASVSGRSKLPFEERVRLELYYAQNWTFEMDIKILIKTVGVVILGKGAQ